MNTVVAIKDYYNNIRGSRKVKVLTKSKHYQIIGTPTINSTLFQHYNSVYFRVKDDTGVIKNYKRSLFTDVSNSRSNKLKELGI